MAIRRHLIRNMAADLDRLVEKPLGRFHMPLLAHQRSTQSAIVVKCPIHITPLPMHFDGGFVNIARSPCLTVPFQAQLIW